MGAVLSFLLYLSIALFVYNYFLYPAAIILLSKIKSDEHQKHIGSLNGLPSVSFIVAAYNEEKVIRRKIQNTFEIDYPEDKLQIIVVSDGSDDSTPEIVREFSDKGVISLHEDKRSGKSAALNRAVEISDCEILVFSDANNDFSVDAIKQLVRHFSDGNIGAVTGAKHIYKNLDRQSAEGDGLYWKYESKIKKAESHLGSITAAEGEILAVRKTSFNPIDLSLINDDAAITFDIVKSGNRIIYEENARAFEEASKDLVDDFHVKVRMTSGGYQTVFREKSFLFPPKTWFAFTFLSHKLLRWLAPHFMILIFILSILLLHRVDGMILFLAQIIFYTTATYGWIKRETDLPSIIYIPMYFSSMNFALFVGFIRFFNKKQGVNWKKADR
jgi:poly-beta-1,6-N-acetyl-D-glucosamine synthase